MKSFLGTAFLVVIFNFAAMAELIPSNPESEKLKKNTFAEHPAEANSLATAVADWIKLKYVDAKAMEGSDWETLSKALATAKLVAPENSDIMVLEFQLKQKADLEAPVSLTSSELSAIVYGLTSQMDLENSIQGPDKLLYGYLLEVAALMDPQNTEVVLAHMQKKGEKNDWSDILSYPAQKNTRSPLSAKELAELNKRREESRAKHTEIMEKHKTATAPSEVKATSKPSNTPKRSQSLIKILLVTQGASNMWIGSTNDLIATVNSDSEEDLSAKFQDKIIATERRSRDMDRDRDRDRGGSRSSIGATGEQMNIALDEALRFVRSRHEGAKGSIELSFEDKYTPKDGGSLGLASALVLSSLFDDFDIDSKLAVTGDISADGSVRAVGAIPAKLEGAEFSGCTVAIIPSENTDSIATVLIDGDGELFKKVQVFSASSYSEALDIAKVKKSEDVQKALDEFNQIHKEGVNSDTVTRLKKVLEWAPNHLSAQALIDMHTGNVPRTYSMKESVSKIMIIASPLVSILLDERNQSVRLTQRGGFTIPQFPDRQLADTRRKLSDLSPKLDQDSADLHSAVLDLITAWSDFQERGHRSRSSREDFIEAREDFHQALDNLRLDEEIYKELIR